MHQGKLFHDKLRRDFHLSETPTYVIEINGYEWVLRHVSWGSIRDINKHIFGPLNAANLSGDDKEDEEKALNAILQQLAQQDTLALGLHIQEVIIGFALVGIRGKEDESSGEAIPCYEVFAQDLGENLSFPKFDPPAQIINSYLPELLKFFADSKFIDLVPTLWKTIAKKQPDLMRQIVSPPSLDEQLGEIAAKESADPLEKSSAPIGT